MAVNLPDGSSLPPFTGSPQAPKQKLLLEFKPKDKLAPILTQLLGGYPPTCGYLYTIRLKEYFYIGSSLNLPKRMELHMYHLNKGTHVNSCLQTCFEEHKGSIELIIYVYPDTDKEELLKIEYSKVHSASDDDHLLNIFYPITNKFLSVSKTNLRWKFFQERKKHMSELSRKRSNDILASMTPDKRASISKKMSETHRQRYSKMSQQEKDAVNAKRSETWQNKGAEERAEINRKLSLANGKRVVCDGKRYHSAEEASRQTGIPRCTITDRVRSVNFPNYYWEGN